VAHALLTPRAMRDSRWVAAALLGAGLLLLACPVWIPSKMTVDTSGVLPVFHTTMGTPGELVVYSCGQRPCPNMAEVITLEHTFPGTPKGSRELWRLSASGAQDAVECGGLEGLPRTITYGELPDAGLSADAGDGGVVSFRGPLAFQELTPLQPLLPGEHLGAAFGESHSCAPLLLVSYSVSRAEFSVLQPTSDGDAGH